MIEVKNLAKSFGDLRAVDGVSFDARAGEILGVLGPNGAGKTTTLRMICGYLPPDDGTAIVAGHDVRDDSLAARRALGYLPENVPLYPEMRVEEYLSFRAGLKGIPARKRRHAVGRAAELTGIGHVLGRPIGHLSRGYRQRVGLADALVADPPVLVLDEPTVGLDPNQVIEVRELIRSLRGDRTLLLSSHILPEVEQVCDRVVIFRGGRIVAEGTTEELAERIAGARTVTLELRREDRERLASLVAGLGTIAAEEDLPDGWVRATLETAADVREELFRRAGATGIVLRELTRRALTLEEVFHQLTVAEDPAPAGGRDEEGEA